MAAWSYCTGATGSSKTWLACALGQFACRRGHAVSYLRTHRLAEELRVLHGAGTIGKWLVQLAKTDVLILDDWAVAALIGQHTRGFAGRH